MEKRKEYQKSKRKVVLSVLALVICVAMLLGTTLAWFTDSVTSGRNKIVAGDLDIEAYHTNREATDEPIDINTTLFTDVELWEPGAVDYEVITVKNIGTVAAKVKLQLLDVAKNYMKDGNYDLTTAIQVGVKEGGFTAPISRESILSELDGKFTPFASFEETFNLIASENKTYGIALYWKPTDSDNNWNANNGKETSDGQPLWIEFGLNVLATQFTAEVDSFDNQYDKDATYPYLAPVVQDIASEEVKTEGQAVMITSSAGTSTIPAAIEGIQIVKSTKIDAPEQEKNDYAMKVDSNLTRYIKTTASSADSVTYDISYIYTEGDDSYNVSEFKGVVTNIFAISTGLKNVRITHSHGTTTTEMTAVTGTSDPNYGKDGYFFYDSTTGQTIIWSSKYSSFKITYEAQFAAAVDGQGYVTLAEALAAAGEGKTVVLLKDVAEEGLVITKAITLSGEGKKISANGNAITVNADNAVLKNVKAESAQGIALDVADGAEKLAVIGGSYKNVLTGKQGEGAIRFEGNNGDLSVTGASLLGGLHVLNYVSGALTISENTFDVAEENDNTGIVCGILIYGSGASSQTEYGPTFVSGNTFNKTKAYNVLIQDDTWKTLYSDKAVAETGGNCYNTLEEAITAATAGGTVSLLKNVTLEKNKNIVVTKKLTFDLKGNTLSGNVDDPVISAKGVEVTLEDSKGEGLLENTANTWTCSGIEAAKGGSLIIGKSGQNFSITGGGLGGVLVSEECTGTINAGTIDNAYCAGDMIGEKTAGQLTIHGGTITGFESLFGGKISIDGGTFGKDPSAYVVNGYYAKANGTEPETWTVLSKTIEVTTAEGLKNAVENASEGDKIKVTAAITLTEDITASKSVTIEGKANITGPEHIKTAAGYSRIGDIDNNYPSKIIVFKQMTTAEIRNLLNAGGDVVIDKNIELVNPVGGDDLVITTSGELDLNGYVLHLKDKALKFQGNIVWNIKDSSYHYEGVGSTEDAHKQTMGAIWLTNCLTEPSSGAVVNIWGGFYHANAYYFTACGGAHVNVMDGFIEKCFQKWTTDKNNFKVAGGQFKGGNPNDLNIENTYSENGIKPKGENGSHVAMIEPTGEMHGYTTLEAAIAAIGTKSLSGQVTIMIKDDRTETVTIPAGANVVINLDGHTLGGSITVKDGATLAVNNYIASGGVTAQITYE